MSYPSDTLAGRLSWLDTVAAQAPLLPDVPADRVARLHQIREWRRSVTRGVLPKRHSRAEAELEREVRAHLTFIEEDRRIPPYVGRHRQSTEADGSGPAPGPDWPHNW